MRLVLDLSHCSLSVLTLSLRLLSLVLTTLNEALEEEPDRKCFRLIGGVLVERTVKDVVPALQTNRDGVGGQVYISSCCLTVDLDVIATP